MHIAFWDTGYCSCARSKALWLLYFVLLCIKLELLNINSLFRHSDTKVAAKCGKTFSAAEDDMSDVYPLQLRLSVLREINSLGVKVIKKVSLFNLSMLWLFWFPKLTFYSTVVSGL